MVRFLVGPEGRSVTGQTLHVNGGLFLAKQKQKYRVPAKAGTHCSAARAVDEWVPAFAGTP